MLRWTLGKGGKGGGPDTAGNVCPRVSGELQGQEPPSHPHGDGSGEGEAP